LGVGGGLGRHLALVTAVNTRFPNDLRVESKKKSKKWKRPCSGNSDFQMTRERGVGKGGGEESDLEGHRKE
jgi:hypothetical protein